MEIWKPIQGYENFYEISSEGRVKSLHNRYKNRSNILKAAVGSCGYLFVSLCDGKKQTSFNVHKLVARAFIPNPDCFPCINHKDCNRQNNCVDNLEWCTYEYNNHYAGRIDAAAEKRGMKVLCVETGKIYRSQCQAAKDLNVQQAHISLCLLGKRNSAGGFHFKRV